MRPTLLVLFPVVLLQHGVDGCFRVDEAEAIEPAVAATDQVEELAAERRASLIRAKESGSPWREGAGGDQHATSQQIGGVAAGCRRGTRGIGFVAIHAEGQKIAA